MPYTSTVSDIVKTIIPSEAKDHETECIDWTHDLLKWTTNYAFVKSVDGEVRDIVVVIGPSQEDY